MGINDRNAHGHCRTCHCGVDWETHFKQIEELSKQCGNTRQLKRFCVVPARDPKSKRWFWLKYVILHQEDYAGTYWIAGEIAKPAILWRTVEITPV